MKSQIDVIKIRNLSQSEITRRELALIKVTATPQTREQIAGIATIMKCAVVDLSPAAMTIEIADRPERVKQLIGMLEPYGIAEIARTGVIAMQKGNGSITA